MNSQRKGQNFPYSVLESKNFYKEIKGQFYYKKQNRGINESSPRQSFKFEKQTQYVTDDADSLSQIRFISKQCSSIKENNADIDCNSEGLSRNQLQDFSPLFDRIQKNSNDDFILEIEDITESQPSIEEIYQNREYLRPTNKNQLNYQTNIKESSRMKIGKIKKNKNVQTISSKTFKADFEVQRQISLIFASLDIHNKGLLTKSNCKSQNLSTELNYFIGSILTKIKVKGKDYNLTQFKKQFDVLIKDSEPSQLNQILDSNNLKKKKYNQSLISQQKENMNFSFQQNNKQNQFSQRLSRIDDKLVHYLQKINLSQRVTFHSDKNNLGFTRLSSAKQEQSRGLNSKKYIDFDRSKQILQGRQYGEFSSKCNRNQQIRNQISLRSESQLIRGIQGGQFQLSFTQLNQHI